MKKYIPIVISLALLLGVWFYHTPLEERIERAVKPAIENQTESIIEDLNEISIDLKEIHIMLDSLKTKKQ